MKIVRGWVDHLIWCPSQCYLLVEYSDKIYTIYLRWRHSDPWTCNIVEGDLYDEEEFDWDNSKWSDDIFTMSGEQHFFKDTELEEAKTKALELAETHCLLISLFGMPENF